MNKLLKSKIYEMDCVDISVSASEIAFSADPMPLDQNCDYLELHKINYLRLFYDDGSELAAYAPAFDFLYVDSQTERVDIYLSEQFLEEDCPKNGFEMISIHLKKQ